MGTSATISSKNVWFDILFKRVLIYQLEPSSPNSSHRFLDICENEEAVSTRLSFSRTARLSIFSSFS
jgi:hypothetical protein